MNPNCPSCAASGAIKHGRFYRAEDAQSIQRFRCKACETSFSTATFHPHLPAKVAMPDVVC